jgi:hypothetical protein
MAHGASLAPDPHLLHPPAAADIGAKYLFVFILSFSYISFAQFVYFLNDKIHNYVKKTT